MMTPRKLTRWIGPVILVLIMFLASGCIQNLGSQGSSQPTPTLMPTLAAATKVTYTVTRGSISDEIKFDGRVVPVTQQDLFFKVGGRVRKVYVAEGDTVKAGQVLADLTQVDDLESQQASSQLNLRRAQIQVDEAQNELDLFKLTTPRWQTGYDQQLAIKTSQLELAKIGLEDASMGVQDASKSIADASIIAPFDGQLLSFSLQEGDSVDAYKSVAVVADVTKLEISADVPSTSLSKLSTGMPVSISNVFQEGQVIQGTIRRIPYVLGTSSLSSSTNSTTTTEDTTTRISLPSNLDGSGLKLGSAVQLVVVLQKKDNVLLLPTQALRTFEGRNFVLVKNGAIQQRVDVKLGIQSDTEVEILDGLTAGQVVIAP